MGLTFNMIQKMHDLDILKPACKIMDIGTQNLYSANAPDIIKLLKIYSPHIPLDDATKFAIQMEKGSYYDDIHGGKNGAWAGELFEKCGFVYSSLDICKGYGTTVFDFNTDTLDAGFINNFDIVLNFGTSEHILNQLGIFKSIHQMAKVGAFMVYQLPVLGSFNHGYFLYHPRFFYDLAKANSYKVIYASYTGKEINKNNMPYSNWQKLLKQPDYSDLCDKDIVINIIFQKVQNNDFVICNELTTGVVIS